MWIVTFGRHFVYLNYKEIRYETPHYLVALMVYWFFYCRYVFSVYPVKYVKIYKSGENVVDLRKYKVDYMGRKRWQTKKKT